MSRLLERRIFPVEELRVAGDGAQRRIQGHAAVFNTLSDDLGGFREIVAPGTFTDTIAKDDVRALFNHDPNYVLGRTRSKTLTLAEDARGLAIDNEPPDTTWANDLLTSIRRGDISQMSFGFYAIDNQWSTQDGQNVRVLKKVQLFDVSPVTFPAYPATDVSARSSADAGSALGLDLEHVLAALVRREHRLPPLEGDGDRLRRAADVIGGRVSADATPRPLAQLRRRLALAEAS